MINLKIINSSWNYIIQGIFKNWRLIQIINLKIKQFLWNH